MNIDNKLKKLQNDNLNFKDEHGKPFEVTSNGSLGLFALGYRGVIAWKNKNKKI